VLFYAYSGELNTEDTGMKDADGAVTYEITATIESELVERYERYMVYRHIPDLMATGCFTSASFSRSAVGRYRIRYEARDREHLDRYLANHASETREDFAKHLPSGAVVDREVWDVLKLFEN